MIDFPENNKTEAARDRDLDALLNALIDDELTEEQADELRSRLRKDPAARAAYIDALAFEALLREEFPARSEREIDVPLTLLPVRHRRWASPWLATGVAAALLVGLFGFLVSSARSPTGALGMQSSPEGTALARVTRVAGGAHDGAQRAFSPGEILNVGDVEVQGGLVEITFNSGAIVTLEPGARIRLEGEQQAFLLAGKVSATVPEQAKGFVIATPRSRVLDLGTTFELAVAENGDTELQVLEGLVETTIPDDESMVGLIRNHEGIRITANGIEQSPLAWPYLPSEIAGPALNPVEEYVHWSFDRPAQDYFPDVARDHPLSLVRNSEAVRDLPSRIVPGAFGGAVQLNGKTESAHSRSFPGIYGDAPRTVACWVKIPENADASHPNGIVFWGRPDLTGGMWLMNWNVRPRDGVVGALRQELGGGHVIGTTDLRDGRWHHVASVFLGGTDNTVNTHVKLYVDGRLEAVSGSKQQVVNTRTSNQDAEARSLMLGSYPSPNRLWTLEGSLDEVYVFDGALTPAQIVWLMVHNSFWLPSDGVRAAL